MDPGEVSAEREEQEGEVDGSLWTGGAGRRRALPAMRAARMVLPSPFIFDPPWQLDESFQPGAIFLTQDNNYLYFCYNREASLDWPVELVGIELGSSLFSINAFGGGTTFKNTARGAILRDFQPVRFYPLLTNGDFWDSLRNMGGDEASRRELPSMFRQKGLDLPRLFQSFQEYLNPPKVLPVLPEEKCPEMEPRRPWAAGRIRRSTHLEISSSDEPEK
jgi:hypothetical protein